MFSTEAWQRLDISFRLEDIREMKPSEISSSTVYAEFTKNIRSFLHFGNLNSNPFRKAAEEGSFRIMDTEESGFIERIDNVCKSILSNLDFRMMKKKNLVMKVMKNQIQNLVICIDLIHKRNNLKRL